MLTWALGGHVGGFDLITPDLRSRVCCPLLARDAGQSPCSVGVRLSGVSATRKYSAARKSSFTTAFTVRCSLCATRELVFSDYACHSRKFDCPPRLISAVFAVLGDAHATLRATKVVHSLAFTASRKLIANTRLTVPARVKQITYRAITEGFGV